MARLRIVIAESDRGGWIVSASAGGVPFEDIVDTRRDAWVAAKEHLDHAAPGDQIELFVGDQRAESLSPESAVVWLRALWRR